MTKREMVHLLKTDRVAWDQWRHANPQAKVDLSGVSLEGTNLSGLNLQKVNLRNSNLRLSNLCETDFTGANLKRANLSMVMAEGSSFRNSQLMDTVCDDSVFIGADLSAAMLNRASFRDSTLMGAQLRGAELAQVDFTGASMHATDFAGAEMFETVFARSSLFRANFAQAVMGLSYFIDVDLSETIGLDQVEQRAPSNIGLDTIYRSQGTIPESFLRDAGVPEDFIRYIPSLIGAQEGIQFYSCFISYSHKDEEFATRLHGRLRDANLRVWYAPEEMKGGQKLHEQIETAIRIYDKLLLVLSEASMASEWVKTEIRNARRQERKTGKRKLFPVRLVDFETIRGWECFDSDAGKDLGVELREYYIPDFSTWKEHDKFEAEFKKLLRDLKAESLPPAPAA